MIFPKLKPLWQKYFLHLTESRISLAGRLKYLFVSGIMACAVLPTGHVQAQAMFSDENQELNYASSAKYVSIGFASTDLKSPFSAFGHSFLIFHNDVRPEPQSVTLQFYGDLRSPGFVWHALFTAAPGGFTLSSFYRKKWEYEWQSRDIWTFQLKLSVEARTRMNVELRQVVGQKHSYNFFFKNCSDYIYKIVLSALPAFQCREHLYATPLGSIQWIDRCAGLGKEQFFPSLATRFLNSYSSLSSRQKRQFAGLDFDHPPTPVKVDHATAWAATAYLNYKIPRTRTEVERSQFLNWKKILKARRASDPSAMVSPLGRELDDVFLGYDVVQSKIILGGTPALNFFSGATHDRFWSDELRMLRASLQFGKNEFRLNQFELFHLRAMQPIGILSTGFTRLIHVGYQQWNFDERSFREGIVQIGAGATLGWPQDFKSSLMILGEAGDYSTSRGRRTDMSVGLRADLAWWLPFGRGHLFYTHYLGTNFAKKSLAGIEVNLLRVKNIDMTADAHFLDQFRRSSLLLSAHYLF